MDTSSGKGSVRLKAGLSTVTAGFLIALAVASGLASAAPAMKWTFHAGDAALASLDPSFSPVVAMAVNGLPRNFHGGVLVLSVSISPTDVPGLVLGGTLTVTCVLGGDVPAGAEEGITADVPGVLTFG